MMQPFILTFCLVASATMVVLSLVAIQTSRRIVDTWIRVENARIVECKIKPRGIWSWPVVVYEYDAGHLRHIGEDTPPIPTLGIRAAQFRQIHRTGSPLVVYVNPDDHQISTIAPNRLSRLGVLGIAAASVCLLFAGLAGIGGM
jgi:hypothetical protein